MTYSVKEIFYSLQGEGANTGRPAVFCRFAGCNLWTGRQEDRINAICQFCDTDFVGTEGADGGKFADPNALADAILRYWPSHDESHRFVVITGGEPLLQLDTLLIKALHDRQFFIAVESNGTIEPPEGIDWLCISPKIGSTLKVRKGQELKFVYPQKEGDPSQFEDWDFQYFYLQPMDNAEQADNLQEAIAYCKQFPKWKLSLQSHKLIGVR